MRFPVTISTAEIVEAAESSTDDGYESTRARGALLELDPLPTKPAYSTDAHAGFLAAMGIA